MNDHFKQVFPGKVVNKRLTINTGVDEFPRFVVEYLIDNYCTEESFQDDLQQVIKRLRENFVHGAEAEKIRHQIRETRNHGIMAILEVTLPSSPRVGEVIGLAVIGDERGCLLHFEMQATKGSGRIISLGSMQKVMTESVAAAAQFIKTHAKDVGLPNDWQVNFDIAVLATMMGKSEGRAVRGDHDRHGDRLRTHGPSRPQRHRHHR